MRNNVHDVYDHTTVEINPLSAYIMMFRMKYTCKSLTVQF